jgi:CubicO group peptidase (beta-lactamase class C family)
MSEIVAPPVASGTDLAGRLDRFRLRNRIPGLSVAVVRPDGATTAAAGCAELSTGTPVTVDTRFLWFSMTKVATATAAMTLVDRGRLDPDAPLSDVLGTPATAAWRFDPTARQLMSHTAGLPNPLPLRWIEVDGEAPDRAARLRAALLRRSRPIRHPGGPARYSNLGFLVLAEVIARTSGRPFEDYLRSAVLEPLGMRATGFEHVAGAPTATGYVRVPAGLGPLLRIVLPGAVIGERSGDLVALRRFRVIGAGYGGLIGPVGDAARLLGLHLADGQTGTGRLLSAESARLMRDIRYPGARFDLGLGWFRPAAARAAGPAFVEHWGTGGGFHHVMRLYPDLSVGVVVMANTTTAYDHDALMRELLT